jgi:hypothetical protein
VSDNLDRTIQTVDSLESAIHKYANLVKKNVIVTSSKNSESESRRKCEFPLMAHCGRSCYQNARRKAEAQGKNKYDPERMPMSNRLYIIRTLAFWGDIGQA